MQLHELDARLLSRAGQVLQAIDEWFQKHPTDRHPTVDQLSEASRMNRRTLQRGLSELTRWGIISQIRDPEHVVGRILEVKPVVSATPTPDKSVRGVKPVVTTLSPQLRSNAHADIHVERGRDNSVTPEGTRAGKAGKSEAHRGPVAVADPLAKLMAQHTAAIADEIAQAIAAPKLAELGHLERQGRLPLEAPSGLRLATAVGLLESGPPEAIDQAIGAMNATFGADYEPLYRKVCTAVQRGLTPLGPLVAAIEEASRPSARHPGKSFTGACKRMMPRLFPAAEARVAEPSGASSYQDPTPDGRSAPEQGTIQSNRTEPESKDYLQSNHKVDYRRTFKHVGNQ